MTEQTPAPVVELSVGAVAHGGHFVSRHEGRVVFVRHALPGERVRVRLTEYDDDARFWRGDAVEVLEASPDRREHVWAPADALAAHGAGRLPAGGAEFGHITLPRQRELKSDVVVEHLSRAAGVDAAAVGFAGVEAAPGEDPDGLGWRTRMAFAVSAAGRPAMHAHRSDRLVEISGMPLAAAGIQDSRLWGTDLTGFGRVEVAAPAVGGQLLVLLVPAEGTAPATAQRAARRVAQDLGPEVSVALLSQADGPAADGRGGLQRISGRTWLRETVDVDAPGAPYEYRVTGEGFWQIHRCAPALLTSAVLDIVDARPGHRVADLYAGAGLFTRALAELVGPTGTVLSIEGAPGTSRDARRNLHGHAQARIVQGRVERRLRPELADVSGARAGTGVRAPGRGGALDAVVLDPPRAGAGKEAVRQIAAAAPGTVAYVSCDPASFARDTAYLAREGYRLEGLRAFDLYPNTHHVELVGRFAAR
ncbi:TRAM domain-containing protein [Zhihengliuella sp.]|uniref:class I SAM-dependent RNA methyltransferase n=1 Tax=Zhihengliuella sp. TaxID=1954483 RepID=UPI002810EC44|nr:TRAM domain-containing protein [Zhihengliuella sp.]